MIYIKCRWDEPRADSYANWGCSWWFFEFDQDGAITRQVEVYDNRVGLRYDINHLCDEFGKLGEARLQQMEMPGAADINAEQFEAVWSSIRSNGMSNRPAS